MQLLMVAALLFGTTTALASGGDHGDHAADTHAPASGHAEADAHGAEHGSDGAHGGEHGEHHLMSSDSNHNGTVDWMEWGDGGAITGLVGHGLNFGVYAIILFVFARRPLQDAIAGRALGIKKELSESGRIRDEARQQAEALGARLDRIEAEMQQMRDEATEQAAREEAKLIERAENEAARIQDAAERSIRDEVTRARHALKRDAVALAVGMAETSLRQQMSEDHQQALARDFLDSIRNTGENRV